MKKINIRFSILLIIILSVGLSRVGFHMNGFTPIGAMALFGGTYFQSKWKAYLLPLLSLFLSDIIIQGIIYKGQYGFPLYDSWYWVYGTFAFIVLLGTWLLKKVNVVNIVAAGIAASLAHWIITDFGVWIMGCNGGFYSQDLNGFLLCYFNAIPYLGRFLVGTLFYSALLFGGFEWAQRRYPVLAQTRFA